MFRSTAKDIRSPSVDPPFTVDIEYSWPIDLRIHQYDNQVSCLRIRRSFRAVISIERALEVHARCGSGEGSPGSDACGDRSP